ncbi:DUF2514 family protein [Neisseria sp. Ec49-e6-T10]|uniref:DUF2514 family protein n=1 Tax=Neisseria sp. Ec49-e6-T10 TaxID=3140744 RepID=UPI003EB6FCB4
MTKPLLIALAALFLVVGGYLKGSHDKAQKWALSDAKRIQIETQAALKASEDARKKEQDAIDKLAQKQKELIYEKENTKLAVSNADNELNRLRQTIANLKHQQSTTSTSASAPNEATTQSWDLLEQCSTEYTEMGKIADEQRDELAEWQVYGQVIDEFREVNK